jgi:small subunit ribosomal protein S11
MLKSLDKKKNNYYTGEGLIIINSTLNNTMITLTDNVGNTIFSSSSGNFGFKGSRKATSFAAQIVAEKVSGIAKQFGFKQISIILKGQGTAREIAFKTIQNKGFKINYVGDFTPIPHNGCRPPKRRRI